MFENPRRGRQARNFTTNAPKILDLKSSSEQIFSRKLPLGALVPFRGCLHRFWNCSTFLIHIVSRWTTASSNDLSIFSNPSDFKALSVCLSITFPHQSTRFFSSYLWAVGFVVHPLPVKSARCSYTSSLQIKTERPIKLQCCASLLEMEKCTA